MITQFTDTVIEQALEMLNGGVVPHHILAHLTDAAEKVAGGDSVSSILVLDQHGLLRNGASPRLPQDYLKAIDGIKPDPQLGTCASAAATGNITITLDFKDDDKWKELRHLPMSLGFVGAWSMPIKSPEGKVIGTFGTYFRERRAPRNDEVQAVSSFSLIAAKVLKGSS